MRYLRYAFLVALAAGLISVALANRQMATLTLLPDGLSRIVGMNTAIELPLFVVIFLGILAGLLIGFVWEWLREYKHRSEARRHAKQAGKLEREVRRLKGEKHKGKDEVLALLE
ncbi:LapA family protein [Pseudooceanicola sp.]|uniref:LapA family protein n=1 Tax=Pseudooceanicola sp. TaxID=1914328 RepID=UPI00261248CB|nr:LapA family protein [Pseudooceanicola sp.]MDF1855978.1 LapA family protein [Pseudooceanicola sp.]